VETQGLLVTRRREVPLCVGGSYAQLNRYPGIELQLIDHTRFNNKTHCPFVKRGDNYGVYVMFLYGWGETYSQERDMPYTDDEGV